MSEGDHVQHHRGICCIMYYTLHYSHIFNQLYNSDGIFVYVLAKLLCRCTEDDNRLAVSVQICVNGICTTLITLQFAVIVLCSLDQADLNVLNVTSSHLCNTCRWNSFIN